MRLHSLFISSVPLILTTFVSASIDEQFVFPPAPPMAAPAPEQQYTPLTSTRPTIADLLTIEQSASIFYSYAREVEISGRFAEEGEGELTVLVPTNKAVMALARKPHQGPAPAEPKIEGEMSEQELDEQSKKNVDRWVSAHIIPARISLDTVPVTYETLLEGKSVTFPTAHTLEDEVRIVKRREALNGVIYILDGTVKVD